MVSSQNINDLSESISVIVPTFNEEKSIRVLLADLRKALPSAEVIVVDAGSDETFNIVKSLQMGWPELHLVLQAAPAGKGSAIRQGIGLASRPLIAQLDSDLQFFPDDLLPMAQLLKNNEADLICGSRFLKDSKRLKKSVPGIRQPGNFVINAYASLLSGHQQTDVLAGIKIWRKEVSNSFSLRSNDFCYEVEIPLKALRCGFRIKDFPVRTAERKYGASSVNTFKTGLRLLREIPRFQWERIS